MQGAAILAAACMERNGKAAWCQPPGAAASFAATPGRFSMILKSLTSTSQSSMSRRASRFIPLSPAARRVCGWEGHDPRCRAQLKRRCPADRRRFLLFRPCGQTRRLARRLCLGSQRAVLDERSGGWAVGVACLARISGHRLAGQRKRCRVDWESDGPCPL